MKMCFTIITIDEAVLVLHPFNVPEGYFNKLPLEKMNTLSNFTQINRYN